MITTTADRIRTILQGGGGKPFTLFMDALLRTHGHLYGVADTAAATYTARVRAWRSDLVGTDLYGRLLALVGNERWGAVRLRDGETWQRQMDALAAEFGAALGRGEDVEKELAWLSTPRAARFLAALLGSSSLRSHHRLERALTELATTHPAEIMEAVGKVMLDDSVGFRFFLGDYKPLFSALPDDVKRAWLERTGVEGARRIARHLAPPNLSDSGEPIVPLLTAWVLERFEAGDRTFNEFVAGTHSLQWYSGDIAAQHEAEAALARRFLDHPLRRVREWAAIEERSALAQAAAERVRTAEQDLE